MSNYSSLGEGFDWSSLWSGLSTTAGSVASAVSTGYVSKQQTEQAKILAASGGASGNIPTTAWDSMSKPLMIGAAALAALVLVMTLTKR